MTEDRERFKVWAKQFPETTWGSLWLGWQARADLEGEEIAELKAMVGDLEKGNIIFREAIETIANQVCDNWIPGSNCHTQTPESKELWCRTCIAREALKRKEEKKNLYKQSGT